MFVLLLPDSVWGFTTWFSIKEDFLSTSSHTTADILLINHSSNCHTVTLGRSTCCLYTVMTTNSWTILSIIMAFLFVPNFSFPWRSLKFFYQGLFTHTFPSACNTCLSTSHFFPQICVIIFLPFDTKGCILLKCGKYLESVYQWINIHHTTGIYWMPTLR